MNSPHQTLGWDDTIKPASTLSHTFKSLSLSPENKRKRRGDDHTPPPSQHSNGVHKRVRVSVPNSKTRAGPHISIRRRLEALNKQQLTWLIEELVEQQPQLYPAVEQLAPPLSVAQALAVLQEYHAEILEKLPLGDTQGDYAFLRVKPQWTSFFVALADYTVAFLERDSTQLLQTLEFLDGATALVHSVPHWTTPANNTLLARAYNELSQAWVNTLGRANESVSFAIMTGAAWDARFQDHCLRSKGKMSDPRPKEPEVHMVRLCEGLTS